MNKIKWIFFDVGSTLVDESKGYEHRIKEAIAGTSVTYGQFYDTMLSYYRRNQKGDLETIRHYGLRKPPWYTEDEVLYPDALACLRRLSQTYQIGIIANQSPGTLQRLEAFGIAEYVSEVVASAEEGVSKPDPRIFTAALERANCSAEHAVMVGDRLDNDIAPANSLGMKTVWVKQGFGKYARPRTELEIPTYTVECLEELTDLFGP